MSEVGSHGMHSHDTEVARNNAIAEAQRTAYYKDVHGTKAPTQEEEEEWAKQQEKKTPSRPTSSSLGASPSASRLRRGMSLTGAMSADEKYFMKQQLERNTKLRSAALELAEGIISMAEGNSSNVNAKLPQAANRLEQSLEAIRDCDDGYKWCMSCGWDTQGVADHLAMELKAADIQGGVRRGVPDPMPIRTALKELGGDKLTKGRLVQRHEALDVCDTFSPKDVAQIAISLHELLYADVLAHVEHEIKRTDVGRAKLKQRAKALQEQRDAALKLGAVEEAEEAHREKIDVHEQLIDLMHQRMSQLLMSEDETNTFGSQLATIKVDAAEAFEAFHTNNEDLQRRIEADVARSIKGREEEGKKHQDATDAYVAASKESYAKLRENANAQTDTIKEMMALAKKLCDLADERKEIVASHVQSKEAEEKRIYSYNEFLQNHGTLHQDLLTLRDQNQSCTAMSEALLDYQKLMNGRLDARDVNGELSSLAVKEGQEYLQEYRDYVFCAGDLLTRKQHRADMLERQHRLAKLQHETALDALDPDIHHYEKELERHAASMGVCQSTIAQLQSQLNNAASAFSATEEVLLKGGVDVVNPVVEYTSAAVEERRKFVEKTLRFVEGEENELGKKRQALATLKSIAATSTSPTTSPEKAAIAGSSAASVSSPIN